MTAVETRERLRDTGGDPAKWTITKHVWAGHWIVLPPAAVTRAKICDVAWVPSHRAAVKLVDRKRREIAEALRHAR